MKANYLAVMSVSVLLLTSGAGDAAPVKPVLKLFEGTLKVGQLKEFSWLITEGGEVNFGRWARWGLAALGLYECDGFDCLKPQSSRPWPNATATQPWPYEEVAPGSR